MHVVDGDPVDCFGFAVGNAGVGVTVTVRNDGVIAPRAVVVGVYVDDAEMVFLDADFFPCFAFGRSDGVFVRIERTTR